MTPKQQAFIKEYLIDLNATQAAIRAGYSEKTAYSHGQRLLKDVEIQSAINKAQAERSERTEIDADYVLKTIKETTDALRRGDTERNAQAIFKGCELLGKHLKLFTDKVDLNGNFSVTIESNDSKCL